MESYIDAMPMPLIIARLDHIGLILLYWSREGLALASPRKFVDGFNFLECSCMFF